MKPVYLEFSGIKSFSSPAKIDFRKLLRGGIFGIFGDTGAGKSTILDSLSFALYGKVNRIGKGDSVATDIINYACEKATAIFEFETEWQGERRLYRVERSLPRKGGAKATLYRKDGESFVAEASGAAEVTKRIETEILGIGFEDFKTCIALPQGEFSQFLQAQKGERLKLIEKLFSLGGYGESLTKRINGRLNEKVEQKNRAEGRLGTYENETDEILREREDQKRKLRGDYRALNVTVGIEEKEVAAYGETLRKKKQLTAAEDRRKALAEKEEEMTEKKRAIARLQKAKNVCGIADEWRDGEEKYKKSVARASALEKRVAELSLSIERKRGEIDKENFEEEIEAINRKLALAEQLTAEEVRLKGLKKNLDDCRAEYAKACEAGRKYADFDYESQKTLLEEALKTLPKENALTDFINGRVKDALLHTEYARFVDELKGLVNKYPQIQEDVRALIRKYSLPEESREVDVVSLTEDFRRATEEKESIGKKLNALELDKERCLRIWENLLRLEEEGRKRRAEYDEQAERTKSLCAAGSASELREKLRSVRARKERLQKEADALKEEEGKCRADLSAEKARQNELYLFSTGRAKQLQDALKEGGMSEVSEAQALLSRFGDPLGAERETEQYFRELEAAKAEEERLRYEAGDIEKIDSLEYEGRQILLNEHREKLRALGEAIAVLDSQISSIQKRLQEKKEIERELKVLSEQTGRLEKLKSLVAKDKFMEYVAAEYLQEIATYANNLLMRLTNGRYFLVYGEKNFEVGDNFNEGKVRGAQTLSGGEVFLVSLSLALSLSRSIQQNSLRPIEFFFLDEGFGTLDDQLVDTVMDSLEKLKREDFSIGIISHVGELKNRLESKIFVVKASEERGSFLQTY